MRLKGIALKEGSGVSATDVLETNARMPSSTLPLRLLRFADVRHRSGLSRSTIWRMERSGSFPKRVKVSVNVVAWREDEVSEWIASRVRPA
jgi:prophage regulatory protein